MYINFENNFWNLNIYQNVVIFDQAYQLFFFQFYHDVEPVPVQMVIPELFCFVIGPLSTWKLILIIYYSTYLLLVTQKFQSIFDHIVNLHIVVWNASGMALADEHFVQRQPMRRLMFPLAVFLVVRTLMNVFGVSVVFSHITINKKKSVSREKSGNSGENMR